MIRTSSNLLGVLNYNEQKVKTGVATWLAAGNYPIDLEHLTFSQKLNMFKKLTNLNPRTKVNSVHISLNFDPSKRLSEDVLKQITDTKKLASDHSLICSINITIRGTLTCILLPPTSGPMEKRIELHNLGRSSLKKQEKK